MLKISKIIKTQISVFVVIAMFYSIITVASVDVSAAITSNRFYSEYTPDKFNNTGSTPTYGSQTGHIQYKMNCYGYAFSNILYGTATYTGSGGYKQQPGSFALTADISKIKSLDTSNTVTKMNNVVYNIELDAKRLGYTLTEYTSTNSTVGQAGYTSRIIAVVTGTTDYHFYVQHSNGTWSHKPGSGKVTNKSFDDSVTLTNANIKAKANQGAYKGGQLKFFSITKSAVIDHPHSAYNGTTQCTLYYLEKAGDFIESATTITSGTTSGRMDFAKDRVFFGFTATSTRSYSIKTTCGTSANLDCAIWDENGTLIRRVNNDGQVNTTQTMLVGKKYYIEVYNSSQNITTTGYTLTVS